ncbi:hypothetical protein HDV02_006680 [Globomyces sp. JEL0801]|nr:hypothetical protein HDV02_006680 [Globomyces sp. JEL0801]
MAVNHGSTESTTTKNLPELDVSMFAAGSSQEMTINGIPSQPMAVNDASGQLTTSNVFPELDFSLFSPFGMDDGDVETDYGGNEGEPHHLMPQHLKNILEARKKSKKFYSRTKHKEAQFPQNRRHVPYVNPKSPACRRHYQRILFLDKPHSCPVTFGTKEDYSSNLNVMALQSLLQNDRGLTKSSNNMTESNEFSKRFEDVKENPNMTDCFRFLETMNMKVLRAVCARWRSFTKINFKSDPDKLTALEVIQEILMSPVTTTKTLWDALIGIEKVEPALPTLALDGVTSCLAAVTDTALPSETIIDTESNQAKKVAIPVPSLPIVDSNPNVTAAHNSTVPVPTVTDTAAPSETIIDTESNQAKKVAIPVPSLPIVDSNPNVTAAHNSTVPVPTVTDTAAPSETIID